MKDADCPSISNVLRIYGPMLPGDAMQLSPELLTEEETIRYLRLDTIDVIDPFAILRRYREQGRLRGTHISKTIFYRRVELDDFIERVTEGEIE